MRRDADRPIPFYRTLTFRLGLIMFLALLLIDSLSLPFWEWLYWKQVPEWNDPEFLRSYAAWLELPSDAREAALSGSEAAGWPLGVPDQREKLLMYVLMVVYIAIYASILAFIISRLATRRVRRLTDQLRIDTAVEAALPGPFQIEGSDEIHLLATTMNRMREQIAGLLDVLHERDRLRREWVSGVSHDLRAPLTALAASMNRSHSLLPAFPDGAERESLDRLLSAARIDVQRTLDLAEDLLEIARLEADDELVVEPVPAGELLRGAVQSLDPLSEERGVVVDLEYPPGLPELQADGRRLIRALENVIVNSVQHAASRIRVTARVLDAGLEISVEDDGPGLPEVDGEVVLRALGPDRRRADSTGIGLEVADRVIIAHQGRLTGENLPDGGAAIRILLPCAPSSDSARRPGAVA